ncbi:hypothetical protein BGX38DRAFT_801439 [Terfezia claveryi]|nr:hypothetical protein BGX38DRAFT_801439 [Terfezia claveryi]
MSLLTESGSSPTLVASSINPPPGLDLRSPSVPFRDPWQNAGIMAVLPTHLPGREVELSMTKEARLVFAHEQRLEARLRCAGRRYGVTPGGDGFHKRTAKLQEFGLRLESHALDCPRCWDSWAGDSREGCHWWSSLAEESKIFNGGVWGPAGQARNLLGIFGLNVEDHRKSCGYCSIGASFELKLTCPWWRRICNERPDDVDLESLIGIGRSETEKALDDQFILLGDLHHSICICFQNPSVTSCALLDCHWWLDIQRLKGEQEEEEKRVLLKGKNDVFQNNCKEEAVELDLYPELTEVMGEEIYDWVFGEKVRAHARRCRWCLKGGLLWIRENCPTWCQLVEFKPRNITRDMLIRLTSSAANRPMDDSRKGWAARLNFLRRVEYHSKTCTKCCKDGKFKVVTWCSDWNEVLGHKPDNVSNSDVFMLAYTAAESVPDNIVFQDDFLWLEYSIDDSEEDEFETLGDDTEYAVRRNAQMTKAESNPLVQCDPELVTGVFKLVVRNPDPEPMEELSEPVEELQNHDKLCEVWLGGERLDKNCDWLQDIQEHIVAVGGVARIGSVISNSPVTMSVSNNVMPLNGNLSEVPGQKPSTSMIEIPLHGTGSKILTTRLNSDVPANRNVDPMSEVPMKDNGSLNSEVTTIGSASSGSDGGVPLKETPACRSEVRIGVTQECNYQLKYTG